MLIVQILLGVLGYLCWRYVLPGLAIQAEETLTPIEFAECWFWDPEADAGLGG